MGAEIKKGGKPNFGGEELYCARHGAYAGKRLVICGVEFFSKCPECEREAEGARDGRQLEKDAEESLRLTLQNIEPAYYGATLDNFVAETESARAALEAVREMCAKRRGFVVLSGGFGRGKTHLASAAAKELGGAIYTMFEISLRIRCTYSPKARETEADVLHSLARLPFLAIDEIGRSKGEKAEADWLSYIIDKRAARFSPTMLLSNKALARQLPEKDWRESLEAALGDDVAQRVKAQGQAFALDGRNWREGGAANGRN